MRTARLHAPCCACFAEWGSTCELSLYSLGDVWLIDVEEPRIERPTEAKARMLEVGICGADREICSFQYGACHG